MPKKIDRAAEQSRLARAALQAIGQSGFEGLRLKDVAQAAEVTTGAVMHYFDTKESLLEAALEEVVARTLGRMRAGGAPKSAADLATFTQRVASYLPLSEEGQAAWRVWLCFWGKAVSDARLRSIHQRYYQDIVKALAPQLQTLRQAQRPARRQQLERMADAVLAAIDGVGTRATLEPQHWPSRRQRQVLSLLLLPLLEQFVASPLSSEPT